MALETEWDIYEADEIDDTETIGWFCRDCLSTWDKDQGFPFITEAAFHERANARSA